MRHRDIKDTSTRGNIDRNGHIQACSCKTLRSGAKRKKDRKGGTTHTDGRTQTKDGGDMDWMNTAMEYFAQVERIGNDCREDMLLYYLVHTR